MHPRMHAHEHGELNSETTGLSRSALLSPVSEAFHNTSCLILPKTDSQPPACQADASTLSRGPSPYSGKGKPKGRLSPSQDPLTPLHL